jgi:hypothetical protein
MFDGGTARAVPLVAGGAVAWAALVLVLRALKRSGGVGRLHDLDVRDHRVEFARCVDRGRSFAPCAGLCAFDSERPVVTRGRQLRGRSR